MQNSTFSGPDSIGLTTSDSIDVSDSLNLSTDTQIQDVGQGSTIFLEEQAPATNTLAIVCQNQLNGDEDVAIAQDEPAESQKKEASIEVETGAMDEGAAGAQNTRASDKLSVVNETSVQEDGAGAQDEPAESLTKVVGETSVEEDGAIAQDEPAESKEAAEEREGAGARDERAAGAIDTSTGTDEKVSVMDEASVEEDGAIAQDEPAESQTKEAAAERDGAGG